MKVLFHPQGIEITGESEVEMTEKLQGLSRFITDEEPVTIDVHIIDESADERKNGPDQAIHLSVLLGGEKVMIEETSDHYMKAFLEAYHRLKHVLEKRHEKIVEDKRAL